MTYGMVKDRMKKMEKLTAMPDNILAEKDGLYTLISILLLFVIHTLVTLFIMAFYEQV